MATVTGVQTRVAVADRRRPGPDLFLFVAFLALSALGILMVFTASRPLLEVQGLDPTSLMQRQIVFAAVGLVGFVVASLIDYREYRPLVPFFYGASLVLLVAVFAAEPVNGARRWISLGPFQLQPAEFAKLAVILTLASVLAAVQDDEQGMPWKRLLVSLAVVAVPAALIFRQPDLGTMLVFGFLAIIMLFGAGTSLRQFAVLAGAGLVGGWTVLKMELLKSYQVERLTSFLDPTSDPLRAGYNRIQSELAIGSGQLVGKGLFQGSQTELSFVPAQPTDFIFTAVGEQLGFIGGALVLLAYAVLIWRLLRIAVNARDRLGMLIVVGVASLLAFHTFVNIGMTIGIMPVTGLPLPFMSAGGSAFITMSVALGIAHSVWLRRSPVPGRSYSG